ncbi:hypothetical protein DFH27DRAFT_107978 [Peziza echinospora]|nr:hypothetical protein DFH27DRAFT_107978 [Peziza echinospora]
MTENVSMGSRESMRKKSRINYLAINNGTQRRSSRKKENTNVKDSKPVDTQKLVRAEMQENISPITRAPLPENLGSLDKKETGSQPSSLPASLSKVQGPPLTEIRLCQGKSNSHEPPSVPKYLQPQVTPEASNKSSSREKQSVANLETGIALEQKHVGIASSSLEKASNTASALDSKKKACSSSKIKPESVPVLQPWRVFQKERQATSNALFWLTPKTIADNPETIGRAEEFTKKGVQKGVQSRIKVPHYSKRGYGSSNEARRQANEVLDIPQADGNDPIGLSSTSSSSNQCDKDTPTAAHSPSTTKRTWELMRINNVLCNTPDDSNIHPTKRICHFSPSADSDKSEETNDKHPTTHYSPGVILTEPLVPSLEILPKSTAPVSSSVGEALVPSLEILPKSTAPVSSSVGEPLVPSPAIPPKSTAPVSSSVREPLVPSLAILPKSTAPVSSSVGDTHPRDARSGRFDKGWKGKCAKKAPQSVTFAKNWKTNRPITDTQTINLFNVIMERVDWNDESIWKAAEIKNVAGMRRTAIQKFMAGKVRDVLAKGLEADG